MSGIAEAIKTITKERNMLYSLVGKVTEVNKDERTCTVEPNEEVDALVYGVRLQSSIQGKTGVTIFPVKGSEVVVTFLNKNTGYLALCSEVEAVEWVVGEKTLTFDKGGLRIESEASDLKTELNAFADLLDSILTTLTTFQLATNVGPTVSVMPNIVADLAQYKLDLAQFKQNLNTIVH